ncbi:ABC transporter ATP-binding protein [Listeria costaricensis]|uniref:ABC transporter ATP-binding protein n=1 Tax=Listeria costaricensis TaxID=2026604 RepID=UPI000C07A94D|nr:ABC transporter ATP-binding protein [Listeria costaricensis]
MIRMEHLNKVYQQGGEELYALRDINFSLELGSFVAIVGPSGSGKSTFMNIVGCLDRATSGSYHLHDRDLMRLPDKKLSQFRNQSIGFIFQQFYLLHRLTAYENMELPLLYRGTSAKERRSKIVEMFALLGLEGKEQFYPKQLSGGQQQRVAIGRALIGEPALLLADEPTGALDSKTGQDVMALLKNIHHKGHTVMMITHDPKLAQEADSIYEMKDGRLMELTRR